MMKKRWTPIWRIHGVRSALQSMHIIIWFCGIEYAQKKENIEKIPKDLPLYLVAGSDDPVGNFGKSVENVAKTYRECRIKDVSLKLYEKDRHEILNELDRQTVYEDILAWVEAHLI